MEVRFNATEEVKKVLDSYVKGRDEFICHAILIVDNLLKDKEKKFINVQSSELKEYVPPKSAPLQQPNVLTKSHFY